MEYLSTDTETDNVFIEKTSYGIGRNEVEDEHYAQ